VKVEVSTRTRRSTGANLPVLRLRSPLGFTLQRHRRAKGLGLNELARLAKVDPAQLSRLEGASQVSVHAATLRKLAKALDMDVELLMRLNALSREHEWTTENAEELLLEGIALPATALEAAIERDPTIPRKRKKWLLECVALARK
jgi:transcriptional regulator with XRE-family HTH domain